jgi:hypothetical protein
MRCGKAARAAVFWNEMAWHGKILATGRVGPIGFIGTTSRQTFPFFPAATGAVVGFQCAAPATGDMGQKEA